MKLRKLLKAYLLVTWYIVFCNRGIDFADPARGEAAVFVNDFQEA